MGTRARRFFARFNRLEFSAPLVEASSGYPELLGQLIDAFTALHPLYGHALKLPGISLSSLHECFLSRRVCPSRVCQFKGSFHLIAWATPSALAQSSSQDTTREDVRPKTEDTGNLSTNTKRDVVPASNDTAENKLGLQLFKNIARDQRDIWTSPAHVRLGHATWLVPFAGVTAGLI